MNHSQSQLTATYNHLIDKNINSQQTCSAEKKNISQEHLLGFLESSVCCTDTSVIAQHIVTCAVIRTDIVSTTVQVYFTVGSTQLSHWNVWSAHTFILKMPKSKNRSLLETDTDLLTEAHFLGIHDWLRYGVYNL